jgi:hypothetical protein
MWLGEGYRCRLRRYNEASIGNCRYPNTKKAPDEKIAGAFFLDLERIEMLRMPPRAQVFLRVPASFSAHLLRFNALSVRDEYRVSQQRLLLRNR